MGLLSLAIWLPIAAGVLLLLVGDRNAPVARGIALVASLATFMLGVVLWREFDRSSAVMQFVEQ